MNEYMLFWDMSKLLKLMIEYPNFYVKFPAYIPYDPFHYHLHISLSLFSRSLYCSRCPVFLHMQHT